MVSPIVGILALVSMDSHVLKLSSTYDSNIDPECEAVTTATLDREMIGIHSSNLTRVIPGPVCVLIIHVVWDTNLREHAGPHSHVVHTLLSNGFQLIAETISDLCLS